MIRCERIGGRAINIVNNLFLQEHHLQAVWGGCGRFVDKLRHAEECRRLHVLLEQIDEDLEALFSFLHSMYVVSDWFRMVFKLFCASGSASPR